MKKKLESELVSIAHRILKLKGKEDVIKMHAEVAQLYEKLSVLKFANENFEKTAPTIGVGVDSSFFETLEETFNNKVSDTIEHEDKTYTHIDAVEGDAMVEPLMETIKDIVAQMPHETHEVDTLFGLSSTQNPQHDFDEITADFKNMPVFEPATNGQNTVKDTHKKSLNDTLKTSALHIGLNDKIAFIKQLFNGEAQDYERVLSQISTADSFEEAHNLIQNIIKPDYDNWVGKEVFEERFMEIVQGKFN